MKSITTSGIDLAKKFPTPRSKCHGYTRFKKRLTRRNVLPFLANVKPCCGSHYWARELEQLGREVRQMPPQYLKP